MIFRTKITLCFNLVHFRDLIMSKVRRKSSFSEHESPNDTYIDSLLRKKLNTLLAEPQSLIAEELRAQQDLDLVLHNHADKIVQASTLSKTIDSSLFSNGLIDLESSVAELTESCTKFSKDAQGLIEKRNSYARAESKLEMISGLLGVPQIMDDLVTQGCYDDAIDLFTTLTRMKQR